MYPWISRTLDFWLQFCEQKCGLYMDVYGIYIHTHTHTLVTFEGDFLALPPSLHRHCTDEAQKAEAVLSAVISLFGINKLCFMSKLSALLG